MQFGTIYTILIIALYIMPVMDLTAVFVMVRRDRESAEQYGRYGIKWTRTVLNLLIAAVVLYLGLGGDIILWQKILLTAPGFLIIAAEIVKIIVKIKFGRSK